jgi:hypothetical protein
MTHSDKIITAARRYCSALAQSGRSTEQRIAKGLLNGVEYLVGKEFSNLDELKKELKGLASTSLDEQTGSWTKTGHVIKIEAERQDFFDFVDRIDVVHGVDELLPYRRRLSKDEARTLRERLKNVWNFDGWTWTSGEYYWEPLPLTPVSPKPFYFYDTEIFSDEDHQKIVEVLSALAGDTIYEVTEDLLDYEIAPSELDWHTLETANTDKGLNWIVYISHEGTIAFGGEELMQELDKVLVDKLELKNKY